MVSNGKKDLGFVAFSTHEAPKTPFQRCSSRPSTENHALGQTAVDRFSWNQPAQCARRNPLAGLAKICENAAKDASLCVHAVAGLRNVGVFAEDK